MTTDDATVSADTYSRHLVDQVICDARGSGVDRLEITPSGRFWLGTLVTEEFQMRMDRGERGERLDPCAMGIRLQPYGRPPWFLDIALSFRTWLKVDDMWSKSALGQVVSTIELTGDGSYLGLELDDELLRLTGSVEMRAELRTELIPGVDRDSIEITVINTSAESIKGLDTRLYEVEMAVRAPETVPYVLEALPDSFRYDRRVPAYGISVGVTADDDGWLRTQDVLDADQQRPSFWNASDAEPDLSFERLADEPIPQLEMLIEAHRSWGRKTWSNDALRHRAAAQQWTPEMWTAAELGRAEFEAETKRLEVGVQALRSSTELLGAFELMNEAMLHSSRGRYPGWRPFQIGFVLAACPAVADPTAESGYADIVWFATGGGKTETYLGLVAMAALYDRLTGKITGVTAWSRFPLRLLSLQQTQRFADTMAGAELVRRRNKLGGEPFSLGFLIGSSSTPNRIKLEPDEEWEPDAEDPAMPNSYRVLLECPFCFGDQIAMEFDHRYWTLEHRCMNESCPWTDDMLPFYVVDDEIYRFLPTVIVGTLDKIASLSIQASMAGLFGPPGGLCTGERHGHTYAKRSTKKFGCLVPGCERSKEPLPMPGDRYAPTFRLQDELHLLRDALGAVDAHYEALIDHLQLEATGTTAKVLGSSATLSGYEQQVDALYRRVGRVFPVQGPSITEGFWTASSGEVSRRHYALAPRGSTLEFANDRIVTVLQQTVRRLRDEPLEVCTELGIPTEHADILLSLYGTDVVYGNTIRDLDAAARSLETQVPVEGRLNSANLTGQTPFEDVREALSRLSEPEVDFDDRIHVITASSMMSHGVDIDRLNTMVVLGLPLTTAEYIQTTARVGRSWPGIVFVLHKMVRERDASTFRAWSQFVSQGDRFVEPIPITRRSVRVLERTMPGLFLGRLLHVHEPRTGQPLTTVKNLQRFAKNYDFEPSVEAQRIIDALDANGELDGRLRAEINRWVDEYFDVLEEPPADARFPGDLCPAGQRAMLSLRDVEQQAPVHEIDAQDRR